IRRLDQYRKPNQLIVNTTPAFARHWLTPRLGEFNQRHPQIDLWLFTSFEPPDMATDSIDLAIRDDLNAQADCTFKVLCT
ncbi:LysR substrate-binding domain-containing protein, partial [Serratia marcescens]